MLLKRDLLETVTIISCSGTILCIILNYISNISPITGIYFLIYILFLFITSLFISFKLIQWLLHLNKPIKYDIEKLVLKYPFMSFIGDVLPKLEKKVERETKEYDTNELSVITTVLEKKLVSSWYVPYISEEIGFPFACKQMLDQMIAKAFEICNKIDNKDVFVDMCTILTSHLKEYKKALKRHETCPEESIESLYKKTHPIFNRKNKKTASADHCTDVLRIILKDLVPWELWDTPYSELLIRILAKKLDTFIETTIANPIWLNDRLITLLTKEQIKTEIEKEAKSNSIENVTTEARADKCNDKTEVIQSKADDIKSNVVEKKEAKKDNEVSQGTEPIDVKPVLRQRRGRQGRNEVKIYDRIIEGSVKTWETDMDLQCISVGQDLLASLDEMTLSRLWGHEEADHSPNMRTVSPQPLWFGEEDTMEFDLESGQSKKDSSPKPAELLRDLQSTVHQAKARIGDLQVPYIDVTRNNSDEAAGMMEGLFDKGIAGIKKGLRFTGLSDDSQEKQDKSPAHRGSEKVSPELQRHKIKSEVSEAQEAYTTMGTPKEENDLSHHLVKQQRITSQDSVMVRPPAWSPHSSSPPSPEPQYEEAADLSASIAKLRSLLQHAGPSAEEVWWEGAEETRGRPATNITRPPDTAALADEYDMNLERNASPGQTTNNMQRLDKLFTRTVTGVFNSIRTAVGAEGEGPAGGPSGGAVRGPLADWTYVSTSPELSVCSAAGRVVGSRRALWHVDSALDSLHQLGSKEVEDPRPLDLEEWLCVCGGRWAGLLEVCAALGLMSTHLAFRLTTVLCADTAESVIGSCLDEWSSSLKKQVFVYFEQLAADTSEQHERQLREFDVEETCNVIMKNIPEWCVLSDERARYAVRTAVCSMQHAPVLRDVLHRAMDALAGRARAAGGQH